MANPVSAAILRADFPEFASLATYPASQVALWLTVAYKMVNRARWDDDDLYKIGIELFAAHHLALEAMAQAEAKNGAPPGMHVGAINNESIDKVSAGYDTGASLDEKAGHWNLTIYGTRFWQISNLMGSGPLQIGVPGGCSPCGSGAQYLADLSAGNAYCGPWPWNFPNMNE